jgi:hypothetical protein
MQLLLSLMVGKIVIKMMLIITISLSIVNLELFLPMIIIVLLNNLILLISVKRKKRILLKMLLILLDILTKVFMFISMECYRFDMKVIDLPLLNWLTYLLINHFIWEWLLLLILKQWIIWLEISEFEELNQLLIKILFEGIVVKWLLLLNSLFHYIFITDVVKDMFQLVE